MIKYHAQLDGFASAEALASKLTEAKSLTAKLDTDTMTGWVNLPVDYDREEFARIKQAADKIKKDSRYLVCIGIGGSYLGARAVIEALGSSSTTQVLFAGNSLSPSDLQHTLDTIGDSDFSINIISKSGTTTEPAIAFRIFKQKLIEKYGMAEASKRIYATTDAQLGALHDEASEEGYVSFIVPDDTGGRYSVLTTVGLLPIAVAGIDIDALMSGASEEQSAGLDSALEYAATRNTLLAQGFDIEVLASFEPRLAMFHEWWKQLFGESEGKNHKGIFPASVIYTTDLHSMGQYLQEGRRNLQETVITITAPSVDIEVPATATNTDGLAYLEGKTLSYINKKACEATIEAHLSGGVPVGTIEIPDLSAHSLGSLIYFFEYACAISAYLLGVNPFDQPGVEAYKQNMFRLLGKPS